MCQQVIANLANSQPVPDHNLAPPPPPPSPPITFKLGTQQKMQACQKGGGGEGTATVCTPTEGGM